MKYKVKDADTQINFSENTIVQKLSCRLRWTWVAIGVLAGSLVALAVYPIVIIVTKQHLPRPCLSEQCLHTASRILESMNRDMDPCEDFYEFACGGWIEKNPTTDTMERSHQLGNLRLKLSDELKEVLEENDDGDLPKSVLKAKSLYRLCMKNANNATKNRELTQQFLQGLGLTPRPPVQASASFSWEVTAGRGRRRLDQNALLSLKIFEDVKNTTKYRIMIEQVAPGINEKYLLDPTRFESELKKHHKRIKDAIAAADPKVDAKKFADDVLEFSTSIAKAMVPEEVRRDAKQLYYELNTNELMKGVKGTPPEWYKHDWKRYLNEVFSDTNVVLDPEGDKFLVLDIAYIQELAILLNKTDPLLIERYLWWSMYKQLDTYSLMATHNPKHKSIRWKTCMGEVQFDFGVALSYLYVRRYFNVGSQKKAIAMIEDVRKAFGETLHQVSWMDPETRAKALKKLAAIRNFVGFPAWLLTPEELDKELEHLVINEDSFFGTLLDLTTATVKKNFDTLRDIADKNKWASTAIDVNAFYSPTLNSVTFPAGILQPPFFDNGIEALNYGAIGALMGHEITHGFDENGRRFNEHGNLEQWWSGTTLEHYHSKVKCIIDQYSKYHMPQLPNYTVDGFKTQSENIADNGGLRAALHAYQLYVSRVSAAARDVLPGLASYTPEQLLYLGFAQAWCSNITQEALKKKLVSSDHSPNKIRVIGTLSNSEEFASAWLCPEGSPMNPEHKCVLW